MIDETTFTVPEYAGLIDQLEAAKNRVQEQARAAVGALFKAFFAAHPSILAIRWRQYTPYFNDGEPCTFRVNNDFDVRIDGADQSEDNEEGFVYSWDIEPPALKEAVATLERAVDEDVFAAAFGDHVEIVATPTGFEVTEYSHD